MTRREQPQVTSGITRRGLQICENQDWNDKPPALQARGALSKPGLAATSNPGEEVRYAPNLPSLRVPSKGREMTKGQSFVTVMLCLMHYEMRGARS